MKFKILYATALMVIFATTMLASTVGPLTTFNSGDPLSSAAMNANFAALTSAVDDNQAQITANGTALTGLDTRVTALETPQVGYASASAVTGIPRTAANPTLQGNGSGGQPGRAGVPNSFSSDFLTVPISLPHGATVTRITYIALDNHGAQDSDAFLWKTGVAAQNLGTVRTTGAAPTDQTVSAPVSHVVDNSDGSYFVYMGIVGDATSTSLVPLSFIVEYTK